MYRPQRGLGRADFKRAGSEFKSPGSFLCHLYTVSALFSLSSRKWQKKSRLELSNRQLLQKKMERVTGFEPATVTLAT